MKMIKRMVVFFFTLAFVMPYANGATGDAFNVRSLPLPQGSLMQNVREDGSIQKVAFFGLAPSQVSNSSQTHVWRWCETLSADLCDPSRSENAASLSTSLTALSVFGPCQSSDQENCIESVEIGKNASNLVEAKLIRNTKGITFNPIPQYKYPGSSTISLWNAPGVPSAGGLSTYAITATARLGFDQGSFYVQKFTAAVTPYREQVGDFKQPRINTASNIAPENKYDWGSDPDCLFAEDGVCGIAQDFAPNTFVRLKLRIPNTIGGWFTGRIQGQSLEVEKFSSANSRLTVEGEAVKVARLATPVSKSSLSEQEKVWFLNFGGGVESGPEASESKDSFPFIEYYRDKLKDSATGTNTFWNMSTTTWGYGSKCLQDKTRILGVVATNAMAYDGSSPSFENGTLNYRVSGLHYFADGTSPVLGSYTLVLRSDVARCLYNFTSAPIHASISIIGGASSTVATTVTNESKGWLTLNANGFTFSEKTIQVKITQDIQTQVIATPSPTSSPSAKASAIPAPKPTLVKKTTITCIKGKLTKTVTAVKPVCPAGYKKK